VQASQRLAISAPAHGQLRPPTFFSATSCTDTLHLLFKMSHLPSLDFHSTRRRTPRDSSCFAASPTNTLTNRLNQALNSSGSGYTLSLCPNTQYPVTASINFAFPNQEISTQGYPTDDSRALIIVNGTGQTTAVDGTCAKCDGVKLRNVQINGSRNGGSPIIGGGNVEMGGSNSNQLVEYVKSYNPRGWTCLHIAEGSLSCNNVTVQNNDVGPCGTDDFQQWADGLSISCQNAIVRNNMVKNPTDGGIVVFGSPGTQVYNNTIWVVNQTLLGGINMVDYAPWSGNYTNTVVYNNTILGGFSDQAELPGETNGTSTDDVIIKIGIAIGPRTWFGSKYGNNVSLSGTVHDNRFSGAFSYAIGMSSAVNFTVENNVLFGNTSFIGARGPNCSSSDATPTPAAFVLAQNTVSKSTTQSNFTSISDGNSLTCVQPPDGGDYWPFGGNPSPSNNNNGSSESGHRSSGSKAGIAIGVILGLLAIAISAFFIRRWALRRAESRKLYAASRGSKYLFKN
jgi:parallel beta-helix repeat protein